MKKKLILIVAIPTFIFCAVHDINAQRTVSGLTGSQIAQAFAVTGANTSSPLLFVGNYGPVGGSGGGVYLSTDIGTTWKFTGLPGVSVDAIAVIGPNSSSPAIFVGATEDNSVPGFAPGGVYRSTNNGTNWAPVGLADSSVSALGVSGSTLFAQTYYNTFRSTDNGITWTAMTQGLGGAYVTAFAVIGESTSSPIVFAASYTGVFRSTNNGISWEKTSNGLTDISTVSGGFVDTAVLSLAVIGSNIFAGTYDSGVYISTNNGANWATANGGTAGIGTTEIDDFAVSGLNIFAVSHAISYRPLVSVGKVFLSTNNGTSWTVVGDSTDFAFYGPLIVCGQYLFATSGVGGTVHRRLLSQMINSNSVGVPQSSNNVLDVFPNPFFQSTTINFTSAESGFAQVSVVNILGMQVSRIYSGELSAGVHAFSWDASGMAVGMYECIVQMDGNVQRKAMILSRK